MGQGVAGQSKILENAKQEMQGRAGRVKFSGLKDLHPKMKLVKDGESNNNKRKYSTTERSSCNKLNYPNTLSNISV